MSIWKDFKAFAFKGNVVDLAVAVVIGAAFGKIVSTLVDTVIMPLVGKALPADSYLAWAPGGVKLGVLIGAMIDFLIVAAVLFLVVRAIKRATEKPAAPGEPPPIPDDVRLLTEIRDLLAQKH